MFAHRIAFLLCTAACSHQGTAPHDISVAGHEAAAEEEEEAARRHAAEFDDTAWATSSSGCDAFCFSTWTNPTSEHAAEANKHRRLAAKHRRASAALRDAEAEACQGIPERDRDVSPFIHRQDIAGVRPGPNTDPDAPAEIEIRFRTVAGLDAASLQHLIDCHLARNAARGHEAPEMPWCPLVPRGVQAEVTTLDDGLVVTLRVDEASRAEVFRRARSLPGGGDAHP